MPGSALAASTSATPPGNFERHESPTWTWYGPPGWVSSEGANDLYVSSPTGTQYLHYGAGASPCYEPAGFFKYVRASYQSSHQAFGLYSHPLASARYTKIGPVQTTGQLYFRQSANFQGEARRRPADQGRDRPRHLRRRLLRHLRRAPAGPLGPEPGDRPLPSPAAPRAEADLRAALSPGPAGG